MGDSGVAHFADLGLQLRSDPDSIQTPPPKRKAAFSVLDVLILHAHLRDLPFGGVAGGVNPGQTTVATFGREVSGCILSLGPIL